jgi:CHAT domain-containing protein
LAAHDAYQTQELAAIRQQLHRLEEEIARQRNAADAWREGETIDPGIVHALLDEQTLFVSYYSVEDQLYALTATRAEGDLQIHPLSVSLAKIDNLWRNTHRQIERRTSRISDIQDRLSYLWQSLIAPLKHRLHNQTHLLILPYRGLYHIPFAGLFDPKSKQYLVECWTVHLAPSMTILEHCQQQIPGTRWPLLIGYPGYPSQPNYLPGVEREIQRVADLFPKADILFGEEATVSDVVAAMPKRSFVHLAGHACYNGSDPLESGMPLAEGRWLRASDLYLQYGHLGGSTVVLSGCDSGRGHPFGGDILGLNSAFLYAGAVGVVAGLWRVDDIATTELMLTFYHKLTGGVETAEALRLAQLELLHSEQYSHPYFWAPFQLNGDSRSLMPLG